MPLCPRDSLTPYLGAGCCSRGVPSPPHSGSVGCCHRPRGTGWVLKDSALWDYVLISSCSRSQTSETGNDGLERARLERVPSSTSEIRPNQHICGPGHLCGAGLGASALFPETRGSGYYYCVCLVGEETELMEVNNLPRPHGWEVAA